MTDNGLAFCFQCQADVEGVVGRRCVICSWPMLIPWSRGRMAVKPNPLLVGSDHASALARTAELLAPPLPIVPVQTVQHERRPRQVRPTSRLLVKESPTEETPVIAPRWTRKYDRCINAACATPDAPHKGKGLCQPCYQRTNRRDPAATTPCQVCSELYRPHKRFPDVDPSPFCSRKCRAEDRKAHPGPWSPYGPDCRECGRHDSKHDGRGLCHRCYQRTYGHRRRHRDEVAA
jgi:hypothetical protein